MHAEIRAATHRAKLNYPTTQLTEGFIAGLVLALALGLAHVLIAEKLCDAQYLADAVTGFDSLAALAAQINGVNWAPLGALIPLRAAANS